MLFDITGHIYIRQTLRKCIVNDIDQSACNIFLLWFWLIVRLKVYVLFWSWGKLIAILSDSQWQKKNHRFVF